MCPRQPKETGPAPSLGASSTPKIEGTEEAMTTQPEASPSRRKEVAPEPEDDTPQHGEAAPMHSPPQGGGAAPEAEAGSSALVRLCPRPHTAGEAGSVTGSRGGRP
ncbi:hypothetical protein E2562_037999 [Oryza meyeriana var. granulata]|uniref:Uncharacterized protein n=1 Tax=Oryza meyeriana var. granulata TaxID=110450 RepID=A0A6G1E8M2_9ORYZ|nr:hypothetical protein E2562_037999 [Oryza meyeriana var. granulata]